MKIALAALLVILAGCAGNPVAQVHQSTVLLTMGNDTCSGTIVGPHTVLTAEHCLAMEHSLAVDGRPVQVQSITRDHKDHVLVRVNLTFPTWVSRGDVPAQGDQVFVLGNPGLLRDIYRNGYVSGHSKLDGMDVTLYDLNGYFGDSGSGIFNDRGELVGVVSVLEHQTDGAYMKLMGSFALSFTPDQWKAAAQ